MSNSITFNNNNFQQTPLEEAYKFNSFSQYIKNGSLRTKFSPKCIFCSFHDSSSLLNDGGSFRQCNRCKKQFKAQLYR